MKRTLSLFFITITLVSLSALAKTPTITQEQLIQNQKTNEPHIIIDVRSPAEFNDGHLKGAINIPFDEIDQHQKKLDQLKDKTMVVYCRSGRRAGIFEQQLSEQGFNLLHLNGDFLAWHKKQLPLIKNK